MWNWKCRPSMVILMRDFFAKVVDGVKAAGRAVKKWVLVVLLGVFAIPSSVAGTKEFNWTFPTTRMDGTPLAASELRETTIYCLAANGTDWIEINVLPAPQNNVVQELPAGHYQCVATVTDTGGLESDFSNAIEFDVEPARPNAPVLRVVQ